MNLKNATLAALICSGVHTVAMLSGYSHMYGNPLLTLSSIAFPAGATAFFYALYSKQKGQG